MNTTKLILIGMVLLSQVVCVKYIIMPYIHAAEIVSKLKPGTMCRFKDGGQVTEIVGVTNGIVYFNWAGGIENEQGKVFIDLFEIETNK